MHNKSWIPVMHSIMSYSLMKVHVWEGISRKGATKVCIFDGIMDAELYCRILETTLLPFINQTLPDHGFVLDKDPNIRQDERGPSSRRMI